MFSRMLSLGNRAVALAAYDIDFTAVRQRSEREGSLYSFKKLPELELDVEDDTECRKFLWNYVGHIFGQVEEVLVELWDMQIEVLRSIMAKDQLQFGGIIVDSFLDPEAQSDDFSTSILVRGRAMNGLIEELGTNSCFVGKVLLSRYHTKESTPELLEMSYCLDLVGCEIRSSVDFAITAPGYSYPPICYPCALVIRSTSITMLGRLKANRVSSLAKTVYNRDFYAVRDRTDGQQDVYNFKAARAQEIDHEAERKNELREHVVSAFGEIRRVYCVANETYYIRLACPKDATCDGINVFRMQLRTLRIIIAVDEADLIVLRPRSNEERTAMERLYCVPEAIGEMLECKLVLERRLHYQRGEAVVKGYELSVVETRICDSDEIARINEGYECDIRLGSACRICTKRKHLEKAGRLALAAVEYGVDFSAIGQMSGADAEDFLFVELTPSVAFSDYRFGPCPRVNILIGQLNYISEPHWIEGHGCSIICLRIRGFANGSCEEKRIYRKQLRQLRQILDADGGTENNDAESWFDMSSCCGEWSRRDDCFYVMLKNPAPGRIARFKAIRPGDGLAFCCTMTRIDTTMSRSKIANLEKWRGPCRVKGPVVNFVLLSRS
ncbi:hypothetical protein C8F04DRAFT_1196419 [Mycena alexandri]|uniref:Uncharacterized protein n=1 Tax=Mycena alexandri TaxID=1745969 RepID=A0AAD6S4F8_9AGAR|nr:hypothetical protein C8F04DRAFT_1196419 [Mycena alexandri]